MFFSTVIAHGCVFEYPLWRNSIVISSVTCFNCKSNRMTLVVTVGINYRLFDYQPYKFVSFECWLYVDVPSRNMKASSSFVIHEYRQWHRNWFHYFQIEIRLFFEYSNYDYYFKFIFFLHSTILSLFFINTYQWTIHNIDMG